MNKGQSKHNKTVSLPVTEVSRFLSCVKDDPAMRSLIGQTGHSVEIRSKSTISKFILYHRDKDTLYTWTTAFNYWTLVSRCMNQNIREVIQIELHPNNMK
jgi:hypothetical protein